MPGYRPKTKARVPTSTSQARNFFAISENRGLVFPLYYQKRASRIERDAVVVLYASRSMRAEQYCAALSLVGGGFRRLPVRRFPNDVGHNFGLRDVDAMATLYFRYVSIRAAIHGALNKRINAFILSG